MRLLFPGVKVGPWVFGATLSTLFYWAIRDSRQRGVALCTSPRGFVKMLSEIVYGFFLITIASCILLFSGEVLIRIPLQLTHIKWESSLLDILFD